MKKNRALIAVAAVAVLTAGSIGSIASASLESPTAYKIASVIGINKNLEAYETVVGKSVTKEDITLTLNEVILNGNELIVSVTSNSPVYNSDQLTHPSGTVYINGKEINLGARGTLTVLDANTVQTVLSFPLDQEYTGEVDVKVQLATPLDGDVMTRSPHWNFEFKAVSTK